ncbi:hypothetical protein Acr_20g0011760 [Actinidia rufa]|uniref:Uncharacterized protein n=1 Tax=Actinidia rufa TaxID=165716 RepID=A0A7J0GF76_9ERIC|nr:hypothetical protein Acr_20g0011760 [Actinidia rufa]
MGVEMLKIGVQIRKFAVISIRLCFRSVCDHPFIVGMAFILFFLYRSFPFLFTLFVSASPVLVCTAILLGTLLSFGQPNIPEIEKEEKITHEIASLKTGIQRDDTVIERDENFGVERYTEKRRDVVEKSIEEPSFTADTVTQVDKNGGSLVFSAPLIEENSREIQLEKQVNEEEERELHVEKLEDGVFLGNQYSRIETVEENVELERDKSPVESVGSSVADHEDISPISPWKPVEEEEEDVDVEASDTESEGAESSSPDASMADIIPMLDELHPLLDEDAPQPAHMSHDGSDAGSERSQKTSDGIDESDEDSQNHEEEVADDDNDDDEEEEEIQGGKDEAVKSAITWTEDDQKNLMDLGTSELERNQRLENLIARRRARRMMTEKNLIDLDSADLPFNIAPISTARRNPFDLPYDPNHNMGLPPIPGSAPSILLPRRNPFDIPYDSSEEKPDLKGDSFQQEFTSYPPKEMFFRRHESFNVGPSMFSPSKQERQDFKFKPYFVPERVALEGTSYSTFQRQSSELSDSKASSVPETESIGSAGDQDDKQHIEEDVSQDAELISDLEHPSEHVGHGSESSEDVDTVELGQADKRGIGHDEVDIEMEEVESPPEILSSFSESRDLATPREHDAAEILLNTRADEVNYSSRSSSSSLSEVHERIFDEKGDKVSPNLQPEKENVIEESGLSIQLSFEESGLNASQHKEPVYDSSPPPVQKNLSSSSISSDLQVETSGMSFMSVLVKRTVSSADSESEVTNQSIGVDRHSNEEILVDSSQVDLLDENETVTSGITEKAENVVLYHGFSEDDQKIERANASIVPEFVAEPAPVILKPYFDPEAAEDQLVYQDRSYQHQQDLDPSSSFDTNVDVAVHQVVSEEDVASAASCFDYKTSDDLSLTASKEEQLSVVGFEQVSGIHPTASYSENESIEEHPLDKEVAFEINQDQVHSSSSNANFCVATFQEANAELLSTHSERVSEENHMYELEEQLPMSDKVVVESSSENHEELVDPSIIQMETIVEVRATSNLDALESKPENKVSSITYSLLTSDSTSFPSEVSETRSPTNLADLKDNALDGVENLDHILVQPFNYTVEAATGSQVHEQDIIDETDEIKEIDEGLLMELDAVGDFSVKELGPNFSEIENNGEETILEMPLVDTRSVEDIDSIFKKTEPVPVETEVEIREVEIPQQSEIKEEIKSGMPVLEARSLEDIDTAFRQISEEQIKMPVPVAVESVDAELIPEETKAGLSENEISHGDSSLIETKTELPVVEARSVEDIELAFKQLRNIEGNSTPGSIDDGRVVAESRDVEELISDLDVERESKPSSVEDRLEVLESKIPEELTSDLHVAESRSLEEADMALKVASEGNVDTLLKSDFEDGSAKSESNEVGSSTEIKSNIKEPGLPENSASAAEQPGHVAQTSDDLSDGKGTNKKSHKLSSSSSSSSSSSDSE